MAHIANEEMQALVDVVRAQSPKLAGALSGPGAGIALAALGRSLLQDAQASAPEVLAAARGEGAPQAITAAEQMCQLRLRESGSGLADLAPEVAKALLATQAEATQLGYADVKDARQRQLSAHDRINEILAYAVTAGFFAILAILIFFDLKPNSAVKDILFTLLGVVGTGWANVIGFYFGSSASSAQKTQAMAAALVSRPPSPSNTH